MARPVSRPTGHHRPPSSLLPFTLPPLSRLTSNCLISLLLLFLSCPPYSTLAQPLSSIPFLSDQPRHTLPPPVNSSYSYTTVQLTVQYLTQLVVVTSNSADFTYSIAAIPSVVYEPGPSIVTSTGTRSLLLGASYFHSTSFATQCASADPTSSGNCIVTLSVLNQGIFAGITSVYYSVYTATTLQYNTAYSNTGQSGSISYYSRYVAPADLNVLFDLTVTAPNYGRTTAYTVMLIASEHQQFTLLYPTVANVSAVDPYADETYLVASTSVGFSPGQYIVGLYCNNQMFPSSSLTLIPAYQPSSDGSSTTTGYTTVLSVMALILSLAVASIILFRVCVLVRRRQSQLVVMSRAEAAIFQPPISPIPQLAVPVTLHPRQHGATEAEIAALPEMVYVRTMGVEGDEPDDPRCAICLDDFVPHLSHITTLRCGHTFHSTCAHSWLRQRRYCPLCLQIIDRAHDVAVKKDRLHSPSAAPPPPDVELSDLSHASFARPSTASSMPLASDAASDISFSRPTRASDDVTQSGAALRHWDDEDVDVPSRSVALSDDRANSRQWVVETPSMLRHT